MNTTKALAIGLVAAGLAVGQASAADYGSSYGQQNYTPTSYNSAGYNWEGFYAGLYGGVWPTSGGSTTVGAMAGVNFAINDIALAGGEVQFGHSWKSGSSGNGILALGRLGLAVSDAVMVYGEAGGGLQGGSGVYALGGGLEVAATQNLALRGDILGVGGAGSPTGARVTVGGLWYFN